MSEEGKDAVPVVGEPAEYLVAAIPRARLDELLAKERLLGELPSYLSMEIECSVYEDIVLPALQRFLYADDGALAANKGGA